MATGLGLASKTVVVQGLNPITTDDTIEYYFCNKKRSGGGPVHSVQRSADQTQAFVTFENYADAESVTKREGLTLDKHALRTHFLEAAKEQQCIAGNDSQGTVQRDDEDLTGTPVLFAAGCNVNENATVSATSKPNRSRLRHQTFPQIPVDQSRPETEPQPQRRQPPSRRIQLSFSSGVVERIVHDSQLLSRLVQELKAVNGKFQWEPPHDIIVKCLLPDAPEDWETSVMDIVNKFIKKVQTSRTADSCFGDHTHVSYETSFREDVFPKSHNKPVAFGTEVLLPNADKQKTTKFEQWTPQANQETYDQSGPSTPYFEEGRIFGMGGMSATCWRNQEHSSRRSGPRSGQSFNPTTPSQGDRSGAGMYFTSATAQTGFGMSGASSRTESGMLTYPYPEDSAFRYAHSFQSQDAGFKSHSCYNLPSPPGNSGKSMLDNRLIDSNFSFGSNKKDWNDTNQHSSYRSSHQRQDLKEYHDPEDDAAGRATSPAGFTGTREVLIKVFPKVVQRVIGDPGLLRKLSTNMKKVDGKFRWKQPDHIIIKCTSQNASGSWEEKVKAEVQRFNNQVHLTLLKESKCASHATESEEIITNLKPAQIKGLRIRTGSGTREVLIKVDSKIVQRVIRDPGLLRELTTDMKKVDGKFRWKQPDHIIIKCTSQNASGSWEEKVKAYIHRFNNQVQIIILKESKCASHATKSGLTCDSHASAKLFIAEEIITNLKPAQIKGLSIPQVLRGLQASYKNLGVEVDKKNKTAKVQCPEEVMKKAFTDVLSLVQLFRENRIPLNPAVIKMFKKEDAREWVQDTVVEGNQLLCHWEVGETHLILSAHSAVLNVTESYFKDIFSEKAVDVDEKEMQVVRSPAWQEFLEEIENEDRGGYPTPVLLPEKKKITIVDTPSNIARTRRKLREFLDKSQTGKQTLCFGANTVQVDAVNRPDYTMSWAEHYRQPGLYQQANMILGQAQANAAKEQPTKQFQYPQIPYLLQQPGVMESAPKHQNRKDLLEEKKSEMALPGHWESMKGDKVKRVALKPDSAEYKKVAQHFGNPASIKKIERIQNPSLFNQFKMKKKELELYNPKGTENEKRLFHGTPNDSVDAIIANGFNRSYCGRHGTLLGAGVYFAADSNTSRGYAQGGHMFQARVLVGEYTQGNVSMRFAPNKPGTNRPYDSVANAGTGASVFVIFHDSQAYPEYLISFQ